MFSSLVGIGYLINDGFNVVNILLLLFRIKREDGDEGIFEVL